MPDVVMITYNFNEELSQLTKQAIYSVRQTPMGKIIIL